MSNYVVARLSLKMAQHACIDDAALLYEMHLAPFAFSSFVSHDDNARLGEGGERVRCPVYSEVHILIDHREEKQRLLLPLLSCPGRSTS